jgi:hypothetical protein
MRLTIDSGKLLYALGVLFAAAALLYFARDVVFDLSITVKAALLFLAFVAFFVAGTTLQRDVLDVVAFALSGVTYIVFVGYVVVRYDPGDTGIFLLLALSAALFVTLGYGLREKKLTVPRRQAVLVAGALLLVSGVLVGADALGGGVVYDFESEESVTVEPVTADEPDFYGEREVQVGTVTATNEFVFTRALSLPPLRGCLAGVGDVPRNRVWVQYDYDGYNQPDTIAGGTAREFPVRASIPVDANRTDAVTYTIEQGRDCDGQRDTPTLVVSVGANETR